MRKKIKLKKTKTRKYKFKVIIFLTLLFIFFLFMLLSKESIPIIENYAKEQSKKNISLIISNSVKKTNNKNLDKIVKTAMNDKNEIVGIDYNTFYVNKFLAEIIDNINEELSKTKELSLYVPFGIVFKNPFLVDLGPKLKASLKVIGSPETNIDTKVKSYGINNALIEISVKINIEMEVLLPPLKSRVLITQNIPVAIKVVNGNVPKYYGGSFSDSSNIYSIPMEN